MGLQDVLVRAHELAGEFDISHSSYHENDRGLPCPPDEAQRHCTVGLLYRATYELKCPEVMVDAIVAVHEALALPTGTTITYWNDHLATDEDVRALFRRLSGVPEPQPVHENQQELALV